MSFRFDQMGLGPSLQWDGTEYRYFEMYVNLYFCELKLVKLGRRHISCNNVAPVTNLCLGRATTRSHSSQWSKTKVPVET